MPISTAVGLPGGKAQALTSRTISLHGAEPLTPSSAPELAGYACSSALGSGAQPYSAKVVFDIDADDGAAYIRNMTQTMSTWAPALVLRQQEIKIYEDGRNQAKAENLAQKRSSFFAPKKWPYMGDRRIRVSAPGRSGVCRNEVLLRQVVLLLGRRIHLPQ